MRLRYLFFIAAALFFGGFTTAQKAKAEPPPASTYCQMFPVVCLTDNKVPDLRLQVNGFTALTDQTVVVAPVLQADSSNQVTVRIRYWDANNFINGATPCIATRTLAPLTTITINGVNLVTPWNTTHVNNWPSPAEFARAAPEPIVIGNLKQLVRNTVDLTISCTYITDQYTRKIRIPIDGYDPNNNQAPTSTFTGTALPTIPYDAAPNTTQKSHIAWSFRPNDLAVGTCTARYMRVGDINGWQYPPWGQNGYLKANDDYDAGMLFPNAINTTWTYNFELSCTGVAGGPKKFTLLARRLDTTEGNFTFRAGSLPEMPYNAPTNSGMSTNIGWDLVGSPGTCSISQVRIDGAWYNPGINNPNTPWGHDAYIKAHALDGVDVAFQYPNTPGASYTYIFEMNCLNDPNGPQQVTLLAYRGTAPSVSFAFKATDLPVIPADAPPGSTRPATLSWVLNGDVGNCTIVHNSTDGSYTPDESVWGTTSYIANNASATVDFTYPDSQGTIYDYTFEMSCSNVPGSQQATLQAQRRSAGAGRVLNFGYGSSRF